MDGFTDWFERSYKGVILGLVAIGAVTMVVLALQHVAASQPAANAEAGPIPTFSSSTTAAMKRQPDAAMRMLGERDRPFTVSVIGDSTGAIEDNWVRQVAEWMSTKYDRPVEFHQWSVGVTPNAYRPVETIGAAGGAPIVVWNGSAEGKDIRYSESNWSRIVPIESSTVDLAFINHGHNVAAGQLATEGTLLARKMSSTMTNASVVVIAQNPQLDSGGTLGPAQASNVKTWTMSSRAQGYAVVDVLTAFEQQGDYSKLLVGSVHPNAEGFAIWAQAVEKVLTP